MATPIEPTFRTLTVTVRINPAINTASNTADKQNRKIGEYESDGETPARGERQLDSPPA
jgi:hypothetical protein